MPASTQPLSSDAKEMLEAMVEPVAKFFAETNDASKNDETASVPPEVRDYIVAICSARGARYGVRAPREGACDAYL